MWYSRGALGAQKAGNQVGFGTQMPEEVRYAVKTKMQTEILSQFKGENLFSLTVQGRESLFSLGWVGIVFVHIFGGGWSFGPLVENLQCRPCTPGIL